jgi:hypothetical protein
MNYKGGGGGGKAGGRSKPEGGGASGASGATTGASFGGYSEAHFNAAFDKSPGAKDDLVTLADFRSALGGTRAEQDAAIRQARIAGKFSLDTHEGLFESSRFQANRAKIMDATITESGSRYVYISRR